MGVVLAGRWADPEPLGLTFREHVPLLRATSFKSLTHISARWSGSAKTKLDTVRTARVAPVDRVLPDVLAHDGAWPELEAPLRGVDELRLVQAVALGRRDVRPGLRVARPADVRV